jgi:hypothetical protein
LSESFCNTTGLRDKAALKRYVRVSDQKSQNELHKDTTEEHPSEQVPAPRKSGRRRRRSSSAATRNQQQPAASKVVGAVEKKPVTDAEEDP